MAAFGYVRKSRMTTDHHLSPEVQEAAIREMAARYGDGEVTILSDLNRSGRKGADGRPGYAQLLAAVEAGECTEIYAYSLSRLSRSLSEYARLAERAVELGVTIRLDREPAMDITNASGRLIMGILAAVAAWEGDIAAERSREIVAFRVARGDDFGKHRFGSREGEDVNRVVDAFREAGTYRGAARLLTARGVPTRSGKPWMAPVVRRMVQRVAPELIPPSPARGSRTVPRFALARLLRCPFDGRLLTGQLSTDDRLRYVCVHGYAVAGHGQKSVSERNVLPWVKEEAARLTTPERVEMVASSTSALAAIEARRERLTDALEAGALDRSRYVARMARLDAEAATVEQERRIADVPTIDWSWAPKDINAVLRALFEFVELDEQLRPVRAEWRVPEWRTA